MLDFKQWVTKTNLSPLEKEALFSLRQRKDVVLKLADNGGAVVVRARDLYIQEAERQLSDSAYYQQLDCDLIMDRNKKVAEVVHDAISKRELPPSTTNLIVDHPRTSKFYLLPKIHKPGNLGRPIVSACNFPTELPATYLDMITKPLIENLPSYVKDTNHMLDIVESFCFSGTSNYVFALDIRSLYIVIPNNDGLRIHTSSTNVLSWNHLPIPWCASPSLSLPFIPSPSIASITNKLEAWRWEAVSVPTMRVYSLATLKSRFSSSTEKKHLTSTSATLTYSGCSIGHQRGLGGFRHLPN